MPYDKLAHGEPRVVPFPQMVQDEPRLFSRALASMCGTALFIGLVIAAVWLAWGAQ